MVVWYGLLLEDYQLIDVEYNLHTVFEISRWNMVKMCTNLILVYCLPIGVLRVGKIPPFHFRRLSFLFLFQKTRMTASLLFTKNKDMKVPAFVLVFTCTPIRWKQTSWFSLT